MGIRYTWVYNVQLRSTASTYVKSEIGNFLDINKIYFSKSLVNTNKTL